MSPIRSRHIIFCLVVAFFIFILVRANYNDHPYEYPRTHTQIQSPTSYLLSKSELSHYQYYHNSNSNFNHNRHEILQDKLKGFRESTYWGSEHPIQERTRYYSDDEFKTFMREEIEEKDADVYWGTEY